MRRLISALLLLLLLASCAAPAGEEAPPEAPESPPAEAPAETLPEESPAEAGETEDHVLLTLEAPMADGRTLTLEAWGRALDESTTGVREVRVYDGEELLQTVAAYDAIEDEWGSAADDLIGEYTDCWDAEQTMAVLDLNFDGNTDFGLFGWPANNTIPYYYWLWDAEAGQYRYAFILQGAEVHPDARELTSEFKSGSAGSQWITQYYKPDESGVLYLDRVERDTCEFEPENGFLDFDRGWAHETWVPPEGEAPIRLTSGTGMETVDSRAHGGGSNLEAYMVLRRREIPLYEINADDTVSHFTEIWELKDGQFQMISREEFFYEDQQP